MKKIKKAHIEIGLIIFLIIVAITLICYFSDQLLEATHRLNNLTAH